jgi:MarR family transcriptional regulator, organic hydroperoxide resistance regulator
LSHLVSIFDTDFSERSHPSGRRVKRQLKRRGLTYRHVAVRKAVVKTSRRTGRDRIAPVRVRRKSQAVGGRSPDRARARETVDPLEMAVLEQFRLIFRSAKKHFQWVQERTGVSGAQLWLLAEIRRRPGIRVTELARSMAVHQSTASNLIERLETDGLLLRQRSSQDQRVVNLSLTRAGRATVARAPRPVYGVLRDALSGLEHADLAQLRGLLEKLAARMKVRDRAGKWIPLAEM